MSLMSHCVPQRIALIKKLCERLRIPTGHRQIAELVCKYHTHCHRATELRISTILKVLESLDAFRRPQRLDDFLLACEADSRGRLGFEEISYPQADIFRLSFKAAIQVEVKDLVSSGATGKQINKQLNSRRIKAIAAVLDKT